MLIYLSVIPTGKIVLKGSLIIITIIFIIVLLYYIISIMYGGNKNQDFSQDLILLKVEKGMKTIERET